MCAKPKTSHKKGEQSLHYSDMMSRFGKSLSRPVSVRFFETHWPNAIRNESLWMSTRHAEDTRRQTDKTAPEMESAREKGRN